LQVDIALGGGCVAQPPSCRPRHGRGLQQPARSALWRNTRSSNSRNGRTVPRPMGFPETTMRRRSRRFVLAIRGRAAIPGRIRPGRGAPAPK
jgi:hypothetical protein